MTHASKSELEIARRHVQEAKDRLAHQEAIVAGMERVNLTVGVELGRQLVDSLRDSLRLARAHLERLEKGASNLWWEREQPPGTRTTKYGGSY